ncbi:MAG: hypothetical protein R2788_08780 [Saprospiraceae bacterium]
MICKIVTLTADDGNGNTAELLVYSNLEDVTDPAITCPGNQTVDAGCFLCGHGRGVECRFCHRQLWFAYRHQSGGHHPLSGHDDVETVTLTADDGNGNTKDCSFTRNLERCFESDSHLPWDADRPGGYFWKLHGG